MTDRTPHPQIWLPLITPFRDGAVDLASWQRLIRHYAASPVDGLIVAATTGEALALDDDETASLIETARDEIDRGPRPGLPLFLGLCGSNTARMAARLDGLAGARIDGYLIAAPYYVRPSQEGLYRHFIALADRAARPVWLYNIPYRTGVNIANDTLLRLAQHPLIRGLKDCGADAAQSFDLLCRKPDDFAVLTGEDAGFFPALAQGAAGGILASAHVETDSFAALRDRLAAGERDRALAIWRTLHPLVRLLFAAPNPAPVKHWLWREGLIDSPELRLPMCGIDEALAARLDAERARRRLAAVA